MQNGTQMLTQEKLERYSKGEASGTLKDMFFFI